MKHFHSEKKSIQACIVNMVYKKIKFTNWSGSKHSPTTAPPLPGNFTAEPNCMMHIQKTRNTQSSCQLTFLNDVLLLPIAVVSTIMCNKNIRVFLFEANYFLFLLGNLRSRCRHLVSLYA